MTYCRPIQPNEISTIAKQTGNHWRKIFNVYAKLVYEFEQYKVKQGFSSKLLAKYACWQDLREGELLQKNSDQCLLFSFPVNQPKTETIRIIMGRTYAKSLAENDRISMKEFFWVTPEFALSKNKQMIICPYFDYRQLSNIKIEQLVQLIYGLINKA